ncbi:chemotaxis protein [Roseomonas genomospecies 6]|uniref:Probable chemoreceptor glutamine deamidase CheD n=1 Tax=Roseomonas genomospecies 6 TaxID=214106 RepID=A0A9W7NGF2_9PROT|nr:chemotaxis protein [Roseomonas genomospecies 6]KAA0677379.1 chemotaxis protein [Roseomonas genomospecies 6]
MPLSGPFHFQTSAGFDRRGAGSDGLRSDGSYLDREFGAYVVPVVLGHHRISSRGDDMLVTTLGSCVAACINDPVARVGGMNHFLLPGSPSGGDGFGVATRYGSVAMERLINDLLERGARRERMEVKLFGAARVIDTSLDVGAANAAFALEYVRREGLALAVQDLGGDKGRRVHFFPATGRAFRRLLRPETERETVHQEMDYLQALKRTPVEGEMELFDRR